MKFSKLVSIAALLAACPVMAQNGEVTTSWSYLNARGERVAEQKKTIEVPDARPDFSSDRKMSKTLLVLNIATELKNSLDRYVKASNEPVSPPCDLPIRQPSIPPFEDGRIRVLPMPPRPEVECSGTRKQIAEQLQKTIVNLDAKINADPWARSDRNIVEALDYGRKLARNMEKAPEPRRYLPRHELHGGMRTMSAPSVAASASLNVTSGGAQGYDQFKKIVDEGYVPDSEVLPIDGFLKEFDVSLSEERCDQTICVSPAVTVDASTKKMYVQISMGSNVTPETFKRKPLNLSVVLDISGSMGANDGTEKSRLEWAKDALNRIVDRLGEQDYLSIVLFDDQSEILRQPAPVVNRSELKAEIGRIRTRNSTNMEAGMRDGLKLVHEKLNTLPGYEHRVITISDAGVNTGIQDEASFVRLVNSYANDGIGVTVLGVGDDFRGGLVQGFSMVKGGNFQHAQTGLAMLKFFENFDYLVTPVAYNFKANLAVRGLNAKFTKAYGIPTKEGQAVDELVDIQTLFFSTGGGAILLEYNLN